MESISNSLSNNNFLLSRMQSDSAVRKPGADAEKSADGVGNALETFGGILKNQMGSINNLQAQADEAVQTYAVGGDIELHNVILAVEKADMSLQLAMQVRNKLVAAYQEISHMQI